MVQKQKICLVHTVFKGIKEQVKASVTLVFLLALSILYVLFVISFRTDCWRQCSTQTSVSLSSLCLYKTCQLLGLSDFCIYETFQWKPRTVKTYIDHFMSIKVNLCVCFLPTFAVESGLWGRMEDPAAACLLHGGMDCGIHLPGFVVRLVGNDPKNELI